MNLPEITKDDLFNGATLICIRSTRGSRLYTRHKKYKIIRQYNDDTYCTEDNDRDLNNLFKWRRNELLCPDQEWAKFVSYDNLSNEQKVLFELHRDVDQL